MSCMQPSRESGQDDPATDFGQASLILPEISPSALAKAGQKLGAFTLEISGTGMAPMDFTYPLDSMGGKPVVISRIPAGARRLFTGRLLDPQGLVTHEGATPAAIMPGKTAEVHLLLRSTNTGNANICVEVEGLPPPANCIKPPDSVKVAGCWQLSEAFGNVAQVEFHAEYRDGYRGTVLRPDGTVEPITTWSQANGVLTFILIGPGGLKRIYTGKFDSPASGLNGVRGTLGYRTGSYSLQGRMEAGSLRFLAVSDRAPGDSVEYLSLPLAGSQAMSGKYRAVGGSESGIWSAVVDSTCRFLPGPDEKACPGEPE